MKICGIICEYNPMHSGHVYHINKSKEAGATHIVCCMSGNYVQRGEPAIIDKWSRAKIAVENGADLVVEIPTPWCIDSAENYAKAGVYLLDSIGCDFLSCGVETNEATDVEELLSVSEGEEFSEAIKKHLKTGKSYPSAFACAYSEITGKESDFLEKPNNILCFEYNKAIKHYNSKMKVLTVQRAGNEYNSDSTEGDFISASSIRSSNLKDIALDYFADGMLELIRDTSLKGLYPAKISVGERAVLSRFSVMKKDDFLLYCGNEDLANRLFNSVQTASSYQDILDGVKNKSVTLARVRRAVLRSFLEIPAELSYQNVPYIKILAIGKNGREVLNKMSVDCKVPIVAKYSDIEKLDVFGMKIYDIECRLTSLYGTFTPKFAFQNNEQKRKLYVSK